MRIRFLGTGTSTGVPQIGCTCEACTSADPHDKRLRASVLVETDDKDILIDCGPDLRTQLLAAGSPNIDALLITHSHYDHVGGIIDLRSYCFEKVFPVYCQKDVIHDLHTTVPYCFVKNPYPGVPTFDMHEIEGYIPFKIGRTEILPLPVLHYKLPILGFKIGDMAYITDCKTMPEKTLEALKGVRTLVINALRIEPHMSHLSLRECLEIVDKIRPERTFLTHISHGMGKTANVTLPEGVEFAYDGQVIDTMQEGEQESAPRQP